MPEARSARSLAAVSVPRPPIYSTVMPYFALKPSGSALRTTASGGPMTTTLPSFLAAATNASHFAASCAKAQELNSRNASAKILVIFLSFLLAQELTHALAHLFLDGHGEFPAEGVEIFHARFRYGQSGEEAQLVDVVAGRG